MMKKQISTPANAAEYKALDKRAGELVGSCENSQEEAELEAIADAMDASDTDGSASAASQNSSQRPRFSARHVAVLTFSQSRVGPGR